MDTPPLPDKRDETGTQSMATDNPVVSELRGIRGTLDNINRKVEAWAAENNIDQPEKSAEGKNSLRSRSIAALGVALIGWKAGALLGAKIGFITGGVRDRFTSLRNIADIKGVGDLVKIFKSMYLPETTLGGVVGSTAGIISGATLGFARGNRIKNPKDFFSHPLKSFSTLIFGNEEQKNTPRHEPAPPKMDVGEDKTQHVNDTTWQMRTQPVMDASQQR